MAETAPLGQPVSHHAHTAAPQSSAHLLSTCCCSSCTFLHTSPAMAQVLPTLVKSAATLSVRRNPAALRFSMCRRHASTTPGEGTQSWGCAAAAAQPAPPPCHCSASTTSLPRGTVGQEQSWGTRTELRIRWHECVSNLQLQIMAAHK